MKSVVLASQKHQCESLFGWVDGRMDGYIQERMCVYGLLYMHMLHSSVY